MNPMNSLRHLVVLLLAAFAAHQAVAADTDGPQWGHFEVTLPNATLTTPK